jgi:hypothetical protein
MNTTKKPKLALFGSRKKASSDLPSANITSVEFDSVGEIAAAPRGGLLVSTRLLFLVLSLLVPLAIVVFLLVNQQQQQINFASRERDGAVYLRSLGTLLQRFSEHRGLVNSQQRAIGAVSTAQKKKAEQINTLLTATDQLTTRFGAAFKTKEIYDRVKSNWNSIQENLATSSADSNFESHSRLIRIEMFDLLRTVANNSNLILDPSLDTFYTVDLAVAKIPSIVDDIGQISGVGAGILSRKRIVEDEKFRLNILLSRMRQLPTKPN